MSLDILKKQIKTGEFVNMYVIYGDEDYSKAFYINKLIDKAVGSFKDFNLQKFDGMHLDLNLLWEAVTNLPVMNPYKCVVIKDAAPDGLRAGDWKELQGIIKDLPHESILIFHFDAVKPNPRKDARFKSLLLTAQKTGLAVEIGYPSKSDSEKFIIKRVKANGCDIDEKTADYIIETCGGDFNTLANETDKICANAGNDQIKKENIDAVAIRPMTSSIYDLAKAVVADRLDIAMNILDELFYKKEEPVIILSALSGAFCDLYRAKAAALSGTAESSLVADFNYRGREFRIRNALRDSRNVDISYLAQCLALLLAADAMYQKHPRK